MKRIGLLISLSFFICTALKAQLASKNVVGKVYEILESGKRRALLGANVFWYGTTIGVVTDENGGFSIQRSSQSDELIISYTGYHTDTINVNGKQFVEAVLKPNLAIEQVEIIKRWKTTSFTLLDPIKVERIGEGELQKAACCNLSESFETNASVDVSFTDAITGTKQIQMLGLAGPYSQITRENIPDIRGLSAIYGLEYVPGTWIEGIQLNKGAGSVVNGFESIAGQINVELRKPESADKLYLNIYGNEDSRIEGNLNLTHKISDNLSTGLLLHARSQKLEMDRNGDGFMDKPVGDQYILLHRWKWKSPTNWNSQIGIKATFNDNKGGQLSSLEEEVDSLWKMNMSTTRLEGWMKLGKVFDKNPTRSVGIQINGVTHDQNSNFGLKEYVGKQNSVYANIIFQSQSNVYHPFKLGASFQFDNFTESLDSLQFDRKEIVPGIFGEYNFAPNDNFDLVAGMRADHHNNYGLFFSPRLHIRYAILERSVLRLSAGKGYRTASILAENNSVLASSRNIIVQSGSVDAPYGLKQEAAWNFGTNFTQKFTLDYREGAFTVDFYYTDFENQIVVDLDENPQTVLFYNLEGKSTATSFQAQLDYELIRRLDIRLAYKWYQVEIDYISGKMQKPLISPHRAFMNLAYATRSQWKFDYTVQWHSSRRIPSTRLNPVEYRRPDFSPNFFLMNTQISKQWKEMFDVYVGVENILDFKQEDPIIASKDPFSQYFDSSLIWGPIFGRMVYAGIRLKIK